jgi:hypothetical protein
MYELRLLSLQYFARVGLNVLDRLPLIPAFRWDKTSRVAHRLPPHCFVAISSNPALKP